MQSPSLTTCNARYEAPATLEEARNVCMVQVAEQRLAKICQLRWTRCVSSGQPCGKLRHHQRLDAGDTVNGTTVFLTDCCPAETIEPAPLLEASSTVRAHLTLTTLRRADHHLLRIRSLSFLLFALRARLTQSFKGGPSLAKNKKRERAEVAQKSSNTKPTTHRKLIGHQHLGLRGQCFSLRPTASTRICRMSGQRRKIARSTQITPLHQLKQGRVLDEQHAGELRSEITFSKQLQPCASHSLSAP
jgi:hypothetical protein